LTLVAVNHMHVNETLYKLDLYSHVI
jgi:hypothetical protein